MSVDGVRCHDVCQLSTIKFLHISAQKVTKSIFILALVLTIRIGHANSPIRTAWMGNLSNATGDLLRSKLLHVPFPASQQELPGSQHPLSQQG